MRLWHVDLLGKLPKQWLMGQHRECCALRGKGWGKPHSTVNYVFQYPYYKLFTYHNKVIGVLKDKYNVKIDPTWETYSYRGRSIGFQVQPFTQPYPHPIIFENYPEHDDKYYQECVYNLKKKGIAIC